MGMITLIAERGTVLRQLEVKDAVHYFGLVEAQR